MRAEGGGMRKRTAFIAGIKKLDNRLVSGDQIGWD
jgi:hypothetical protein